MTDRKSKPMKRLGEDAVRKLLDGLEKERIENMIAFEDASIAQRLGQAAIMADLQPLLDRKRTADNELAEWDNRGKKLVSEGVLSEQEFAEERRVYLTEVADADAEHKPALQKAQQKELQLIERTQAFHREAQKLSDAWEQWVRYANAAGVDHSSYWTPQKGPVPRPLPTPAPVEEEPTEAPAEAPAPQAA